MSATADGLSLSPPPSAADGLSLPPPPPPDSRVSSPPPSPTPHSPHSSSDEVIFEDEDESSSVENLPVKNLPPHPPAIVCKAGRGRDFLPREIQAVDAKRREEDSSSNQKCTNNPEEMSIDADRLKWLAVEALKASKRHQIEKTHTIYKVPEDIRRHDSDAYEPMVVQIGPYHGFPHQRSPMEEHKWRCVQKLVARRDRCFEPDLLLDNNNQDHFAGGSDLLKKCLQEMMALDDDIRSSYSDAEETDMISMWSIDLAEMMLLDGCFILHRLLGHDRKDEDQSFRDLYLSPALDRLWIWELVNYDLLLLENQIPFFVLTKLFDILRTEADEDVDLVTQALKLFREIHPRARRLEEEEINSFSKKYAGKTKIHHLLHLFYLSIDLPPTNPPADQKRSKEASSPEDPNPDWIPSATELQEAGITFKRAEKAPSLLDISFSKHGGVLKIPPLEIDDHSMRLFRNLIALEQFYPDTRSRMTIYVVFMSCVINTPKDMRLLHLDRILTDKTNSEQGAHQFFSRLGNQAYYASGRNYLGHVFREVGNYHGSTIHQWRAALVRNYFSNPWAAISVVAAIGLFGLTIAQTILAA